MKNGKEISMKKFIIFLKNHGFLNLLPDKLYLKIVYHTIIGKKLNLKNPKSFNEKIQWLKLNDRNELYTDMVDKIKVKKIVEDRIGKEYIIKTLQICDNFEQIDFSKLPDKFVIKTNHNSGGVFICYNKEKFDVELAKKVIKKNLSQNYYYKGREWPYKNVKPKILIEELLDFPEGEDIPDYKFLCSDGKVFCSFVCSERRKKEGLAVDFFDLEWNHMPFQRHYRNSKNIIKKPKNYELMIDLAEKLSKGLKFVRIDFYECKDKVYFGEYTFYPGSGLEEFKPDEWDNKLGDFIKLDVTKKNEK